MNKLTNIKDGAVKKVSFMASAIKRAVKKAATVPAKAFDKTMDKIEAVDKAKMDRRGPVIEGMKGNHGVMNVGKRIVK